MFPWGLQFKRSPANNSNNVQIALIASASRTAEHTLRVVADMQTYLGPDEMMHSMVFVRDKLFEQASITVTG